MHSQRGSGGGLSPVTPPVPDTEARLSLGCSRSMLGAASITSPNCIQTRGASLRDLLVGIHRPFPVAVHASFPRRTSVLGFKPSSAAPSSASPVFVIVARSAGTILLGKSSPEKPTFRLWEPLSSTTASTSSREHSSIFPRGSESLLSVGKQQSFHTHGHTPGKTLPPSGIKKVLVLLAAVMEKRRLRREVAKKGQGVQLPSGGPHRGVPLAAVRICFFSQTKRPAGRPAFQDCNSDNVGTSVTIVSARLFLRTTAPFRSSAVQGSYSHSTPWRSINSSDKHYQFC